MAAKYILAGVGALFLALGIIRAMGGARAQPQSRAWLLIGGIFTAVSAWLFYQG